MHASHYLEMFALLSLAAWSSPAAAQPCPLPTLPFVEASHGIEAHFRRNPNSHDRAGNGGSWKSWTDSGGANGCASSLSSGVFTPATPLPTAREEVDAYVRRLVFGNTRLVSRAPATRYGSDAVEILRSWPGENVAGIVVGVRHLRTRIIPRGGKLIVLDALWVGGPTSPPDVERFFQTARVR